MKRGMIGMVWIVARNRVGRESELFINLSVKRRISMQEQSLINLLEQESMQIFSPFASTIKEASQNDLDIHYYQGILKQKQINEKKGGSEPKLQSDQV